jgi:hypothetical protein
MPVISAIQELEIRRIMVGSQFRKKVIKTSPQTNKFGMVVSIIQARQEVKVGESWSEDSPKPKRKNKCATLSEK